MSPQIPVGATLKFRVQILKFFPCLVGKLLLFFSWYILNIKVGIQKMSIYCTMKILLISKYLYSVGHWLVTSLEDMKDVSIGSRPVIVENSLVDMLLRKSLLILTIIDNNYRICLCINRTLFPAKKKTYQKSRVRFIQQYGYITQSFAIV